MLFLTGLALGALALAVARRRAQTIRLRVTRRWGGHPPTSWEGAGNRTAWPVTDLPARA